MYVSSATINESPRVAKQAAEAGQKFVAVPCVCDACHSDGRLCNSSYSVMTCLGTQHKVYEQYTTISTCVHILHTVSH